MKYTKHLLLLIVLLLMSVAVFAKPAKILWPETAGVTCVEPWLCLEVLEHQERAQQLYDEALRQVEFKLSGFADKPRVVFCSTQACFSRFGFAKSAANSIGDFGVVIAPRGWTAYYVEHELIHQWQARNWGVITTWLAEPWLTEGMAYSLSDDPREPLSEPFEGYRDQYRMVFNDLRGEALLVALQDGMY